MALNIEVQTGGTGDFDPVDVTALGIHGMKLKIGYSHAMHLSFTATAAQHELPFNFNDFIRIWDDAGEIEGDPQADDNVLFEGWIKAVTPGQETNEVLLEVTDATDRADQTVTVFSDEWDDATTPAAGSHPRAVFNVYNDNDDDYAYSIGQQWTMGQIIAQVLFDQAKPLRAVYASPDFPLFPYDLADLGDMGSDTDSDSISDFQDGIGGLDFKPQEKVIFESQPVRGALEQFLQRFDPATKLIFHPEQRKYRFRDVKNAPEVTVTVNDESNATGMVLSMDIRRSAEGRYGAIEFYGPEGTEWLTAVFEEGGGSNTLEPEDSFGVGSSPNDFNCNWKWRITDPDFRRVARKGPYAVYAPAGYFLQTNSAGRLLEYPTGTFIQTWSPYFTVAYPNGDGGSGNDNTVNGWICDWRNGVITFGETCLARWEGPSNGFAEPVRATFTYPNMIEPLKVRYPTSGYEGTIYTVGGVENVLRIYDEQLAVGYDYGIPVTTTRRLSRFSTLAQQLHRQRKDLIYAGSMLLDGLQYEFARLNRRVNIAALDDDGDTLTTGWESVGAIVTDVEYDFDEHTTTIQFSSDQMEVLGMDPELMKSRLKIRPAEAVMRYVASSMMGARRVRTSNGHYAWQSFTDMQFSAWTEWVDEFGELQ